MSLIKTITGEVNVRNANAKCLVFAAVQIGDAMKELPLGKVASDSSFSGVESIQPRPLWINAVDGYPREVGGSFTIIDYNVESGTILKVFFRKNGGNKQLPIMASVFLRVRDSADLRKLEFDMVNDDRCYTNKALIEGRFDIITLEEALALGVSVPPAYHKTFQPRTLATVMTDTVIQKSEIKVRFVDAGKSGKAKVVEAVVRKRKLNFDD